MIRLKLALPRAPGRGKGHQYLHFEVLMPRSLSPRQRELIEEFGAEEEPIDRRKRTLREGS